MIRGDSEDIIAGRTVLPSKCYEVFFEHRPEYLYVYLGARANSYEIAKRYWTEILAMLHRRRYTRVLIEKEVAEKLAAHDILRLVSELAHSGYCDVSFAVVDLGYEPQRAAFYELVAGNRGIMLKVTDNLEAAENWLAERDIPARRPARPGRQQEHT